MSETENRAIKAIKMARVVTIFSTTLLEIPIESLPFLVDSIERPTWEMVAEKAGVNPPSDETIRLATRIVKEELLFTHPHLPSMPSPGDPDPGDPENYFL